MSEHHNLAKEGQRESCSPHWGLKHLHHNGFIYVSGFVILVALIIFVLSGNLSAQFQRDPQTAIPIQIVNSNAGRVITAHAERYDNKIYVDGVIFRPMSPGIAAHVHIWGVDKKNRRVFFKTDFVYFTGKPSLEHTQTFQVSIGPETYVKAAIVYVTFHSQGDAESRHEDY